MPTASPYAPRSSLTRTTTVTGDLPHTPSTAYTYPPGQASSSWPPPHTNSYALPLGHSGTSCALPPWRISVVFGRKLSPPAPVPCDLARILASIHCVLQLDHRSQPESRAASPEGQRIDRTQALPRLEAQRREPCKPRGSTSGQALRQGRRREGTPSQAVARLASHYL